MCANSPALEIVSDLLNAGATIVAFDPAAMVRAEAALPKVRSLSFAGSAYEACTDADALLVLTEWKEFYDLDLYGSKSFYGCPFCSMEKTSSTRRTPRQPASTTMASVARRCGRGSRLCWSRSIPIERRMLMVRP